MKKMFFLAAIAGIVFSLSLMGASVPVSDEDLAKKADAIVQGTVQSVKSEWTADKSTIITLVTLKAEKYLKGSGANEIVLKIQGGTVGGVAVQVNGSPVFAMNEEVVVFLNKKAEQYELVAKWRGKYNIIQTDGKKCVVQNPGGKPPKADASGKAPAKAAVPLADFISKVEKNSK